MNKLILSGLLVIVGCGGTVETVNDSGVETNAADGRVPLPDGGSLPYDAAGETR